ncbi:uroporphyrinogen-III C-methyltransferase [Pedococcus sp.]|uniref:uroporphyrinogen-III C-methyltransferase n=1 Tax=Pedococcus sp. TaxID=2860345 RepID=UPI002E1516E6|nr:uroporphyrinogen-III C-methyltransferase [Pedococcus sp.]
MRITVPGEAPAVLVRDPGERIAETVHGLLAQGAVVSVLATSPSPMVEDLATRQLVTVVAEADVTAYDIVVRDPLTRPVAGAEAAGSGSVVLVGGGPGDAGLLTVAGLEALRSADVVVTDRLVPLGALDEVPDHAEVLHVGKMPRGAFTPQEAINDLLVTHGRAGKRVVRFKGGDSFVFGRGGEEWAACVEAGVPVTVIPGVSSALAVPALAGIPLTHRTLTQGFVVVTGHVPPGDPRSMVDWAWLGGSGLTLVVLMGVAALPQISAALVSGGMDPNTPAACVADGGMPSMRSVTATITTLAAAAKAAGLRPPAVTVIGDVVTALQESS